MNTNKISAAMPDGGGLLEDSPINILYKLCARQTTGRLQLFDQVNCWTVRLEAGKITYVTHNVEPFDRLVCHMRSMSRHAPHLDKEFRTRVCAMFEDATAVVDEDVNDESYYCSDYVALCWMFNQQHLTKEQAAKITAGMIKEAIEPLFWLDKVSFRFTRHIGTKLTLCRLELTNLVLHCQQRLKLWQFLSPQIWSPYQRPYFFGKTEQQKQLLPELQLQQKFSTILKGLSFRHLAILLNNDELKLIGSLMPYICEEVIVLRDPQPPFDRLPKIPISIPEGFFKIANKIISSQVDAIAKTNTLEETAKASVETAKASVEPVKVSATNTYTIACVDDSPTILTEIGRFLSDYSCDVIAINDPLKAPMIILKSKADLILLDITMPKVNGYELCQLLRKNNSLKKTPIIMVTGNTGFIDRAKASLSGATDYLTKPFTQETLVKMIFRYLA
jgi:two-component system, chemotaxis family, response regulator PixG